MKSISHSPPFLLVLGIFMLSAAGSLRAADPKLFASSIQPLFEKHCVQCHGQDGKVKGKVNLLEIKSANDLIANPELLEELLGVIEYEEMPPEDEPQPSKEERTQLAGALEELLQAAVAAKDFPPAPIRRLTRLQYNNAVRDLFELGPVVFTLPERMLREHGNYFQPASGIMPPVIKAGSRPLGKSQLIEKRLAGVTAFPQDLRAEHGFDNQGDHLSLSPLLMEAFLQLGRSIVESPDFHSKTVGIWNEFFAPPQEAVSAESVVPDRLRAFLTRAFRRPPEEALLHRYSSHVLALMETGSPFTEAMKAAASAALASPRFLYLYDQGGDGIGSQPADDYELASRLSFFLWGSLPDAELLKLAAAGKLRDPTVLAAQTDRLLNDRKLKRFCDSFPTQWLQLERIVASAPDRTRFPEFYFHSQYRFSMHMMLEPLLLFETILIEDRPILEFIDSSFSYRSEFLHHWYEDPAASLRKSPKKEVTTITFHRKDLENRREGGLMTNAAVMTMTSGQTRTQPITRGAWIASVIFNDPPAPPPADVPPLPEDVAAEEADLTLRERFEAHRADPNCAGCHARLDPLGFAFENYGPIGVWRDSYENGRDIDASGSLFRRHEFKDAVDFKDAVLAEKDRFVRGFAGHLLAYALGREVSPADSPALDRILAESASEEYRFRPLIRQIVLSEPFRSKTSPTQRVAGSAE